MIKNPEIINLPKIGGHDQGYISLIQANDLLPFNPKRIYWIYGVSKETERGGHYHHKLEQVIICIKGKLTIKLENNKGEIIKFILDSPSKALYIPQRHWRDIFFHENAILLCIASENYDENDYVRSYSEFKNIS